MIKWSALIYLPVFALGCGEPASLSQNRGETLDEEMKLDEKAADDTALFRDFLKQSTWCVASYPDHNDRTFVAKMSELRKPMERFADALSKLEIKTMTPSTKANYIESQYFFYFYSRKDGKTVRIGHLGVAPAQFPDQIYLSTQGKMGFLAVPKEDWTALVKDSASIFRNFDKLAAVLEEGNPKIGRSALLSVTQPCFRDHAMKAIPKMEPYLSSDDEFTKFFAADMILKISPSHSKAKEVQAEEKGMKEKR